MPMPPAETVALLIEADLEIVGIAPESHEFYVSMVQRILDAVKLATITSTGAAVAPPGAVLSVSTSIT